MHGSHADHFGKRKGHFVVGIDFQLVVSRIDLRNHADEHHARPVVGRVEDGDAGGKSRIRVGRIAAERTSQHDVGELVRIDIERNDPSLHARQNRRDDVVVVVHIVFRGGIGIGVDVIEPARAGGEQRCRCQRQQAEASAKILWFFHSAFRI